MYLWKKHHNISVLVSVTAVLSLLNGFVYLFFPFQSLSILGIGTDAFGLMITRYYGACAIGFAILLWGCRNSDSQEIRRMALFAILVTLGVMTIVGILGMLAGVYQRLGLLFVISDLVLALDSLYFLLKG